MPCIYRECKRRLCKTMKTRMILVTLTLTLAGASALSAQQRDNRGSDNRSPGNDTRNDARNDTRNDARPSNDSNRNDDRYAPGNGSRNNDRNDDRYDRSDSGYAYNSPPPPQAPSDHSYGRRSASPGPGYIWIDGYWDWAGRRYAWQPGYWVRRPHSNSYWMSPRYERGRYFEENWRHR